MECLKYLSSHQSNYLAWHSTFMIFGTLKIHLKGYGLVQKNHCIHKVFPRFVQILNEIIINVPFVARLQMAIPWQFVAITWDQLG